MKKETLKAVKAGARKLQPVPPPRAHKDKKKFTRNEKHRTVYRNDAGPSSFSREPGVSEMKPFLKSLSGTPSRRRCLHPPGWVSYLLLPALFVLLPNHLMALDALVIPSADRFFEERWRFTVAEATPSVIPTKQIVRKQYFTPYLLMRGYRRAEEGKVDLTYDIKVLSPDGSVYEERRALAAVRGIITSDNYVLLSTTLLRICFEPNDAIGKYSIEVVVRDGISGEQTRTTAEVELVEELKNDVPLDDRRDLDAWMSAYYLNPRPDQLIDAFLKFTRMPAPANDSAFVPIMTFFTVAFRENRHLLPRLAGIYADENDRTRFYILTALYLSDYPLTSFEEKLSKEAREYLAAMKRKGWPDPYTRVEFPYELDMLWATFFATGGLRPIATLVGQLENVTYRGELEKQKESPQGSSDLPPPVPKDLLFRAAKWSLGANARNHKLVREYGRFLLKKGKLSPAASEELREILQPYEAVNQKVQ